MLKGLSMSRFSITWTPLNLSRLAERIREGRLDPSRTITMKELVEARAVDKKMSHGVKLLANVSSVSSLIH